MKKCISRDLELIAKLPAKDRVPALQQLVAITKPPGGESPYEYVLRLTFNPYFKWDLPEGEVPFKPCEFPDQEMMLFQELKRLYLFLIPEQGHRDLKPMRKQQLFIDLLECLDPADARLVIAMKDKKLPWKELDAKLVKKALPHLW